MIYTKKLEIEPNDAEKFTIIHELSVEYHYSLKKKNCYVRPSLTKALEIRIKKVDKKPETYTTASFFLEDSLWRVDKTSLL